MQTLHSLLTLTIRCGPMLSDRSLLTFQMMISWH